MTNPIYREQGDQASKIEDLTVFTPATGVTTYYPGTTKGSARYISSRSGGYLPDWKGRILLHENATTSLIGVKRDLSVEPGYARVDMDLTVFNPFGSIYKFRNSGRLIGFPGGTDWLVPFVYFSYPSASSRALAKFLNNARNALRTFSGGVFIGEIRETARAIRRPADAFRKGLSTYLSTVKKRAKGLRGAHPIGKMAAGTWLEYMFGWVPLMHDIDDGMKALAELTYRPEYQRIQGVATEELLQLLSTEQYIFSGNIFSNVTRRIVETGEERYYGEVRVRCPEYPLNALASNSFGVGLDDFIPTVWELIPYSFLVDYFLNIGDILNAVSFPTANLTWCAHTTRGTSRYEMAGSYDERTTRNSMGAAYKDGYANPGRFVFETTRVHRVPVLRSELGVPSLQFQLNLGAKRIANIGALLVQGHQTQRSFHL